MDDQAHDGAHESFARTYTQYFVDQIDKRLKQAITPALVYMYSFDQFSSTHSLTGTKPCPQHVSQ